MSTKLSLQNLSISSQIFLGFLIVVISVILSIYISYNNSKKIIESEGWVIHTQEVLTQLENIEARLLDLETGQRGFLITGKESYLEPFNSSLAIIYNELELLREKTIDNSSQTPRIDSLKLTIDKKIEELKLTIELRKNIGFEAAKEIVDNDSGKLFMDQMRLQIDAIENEELRILEIRSLKPEITRRETNAILVGLLFFKTICFGKRKRGRPEKRWIDSINEDMQLLNLTKDDAHDRLKWSISTKMADPTWEECL